jgi:hypothetical protein
MIQNGRDGFVYEYLHLDHGLLTLSMNDFYPAKLFFNHVEKDILLCFNKK